MLAQMRSKKFVKRIMKWTLIMVIPSFVLFYGWGPMGGGQGGGGFLPWYAKVKTRFGGLLWDKIQEGEMQQAENRLTNILANMGAGENAKRFVNNESTLRKAVNDRIMDEMVAEYGFVTSEAELHPEYEMLRQLLAQNIGLLLSNAELRSYIISIYGSLKAFEQMTAHELGIRKAQYAIFENVRPMLWDLWDIHRQTSQQMSLSYSPFLMTNYNEQVEFTTDTLKQYFAEHSEDFRTEEQANYRYVVLSFSDLLGQTPVTEQESREFYEQHNNGPGERFWRGQSVQVSHIGLKVPLDATTTETEKIKVRLNDIWDKLHQDPAPSFAELADEYTEDESNVLGEEKQGGRLFMPISDTRDAPQFGPVFATTALILKDGEMDKIDVRRTNFGFHILKVDRVTTASATPFEDVRFGIEFQLKQQKAVVNFGKEYERMSAEWEAVTDLETLAQNMGLEARETGWVPIGGPPYLDNALLLAEFQSEIARLNVSAASAKPLLSSSGQYCLVIQLLEKRPPYEPPFAEVQARVEDEYRLREGAKLAIADGQKFLDSIGEDDTLTSQAVEQGLSYQTTESFVRINAPQFLMRNLVGFARDSLDATTGTLGLSYLEDVDMPQGCYVWQVETITDADLEEFDNLLSFYIMQGQQLIGTVLINEQLADRRNAIRTKFHPDFQPTTRR